MARKQYVVLMTISILLFACSQELSGADEVDILITETPEGVRPRIGNDEDRMAEPILSDNPSQADLGTKVYWIICMACHGDRGQGLTDEWRAAWGPEHMNCWQSKCHASSHPPEGFVLLRYAPSIIDQNASGRLASYRYATAQDYFDYISTEMPWWKPGYLPEEEYWQLTAFLLRENGVEFVGEINTTNASDISLDQE